jgi:hypothetical protein
MRLWGTGPNRTLAQDQAEWDERIALYRHLVKIHRVGPDVRVDLGNRYQDIDALRQFHAYWVSRPEQLGWDCNWVRGTGVVNEPKVPADPGMTQEQLKDLREWIMKPWQEKKDLAEPSVVTLVKQRAATQDGLAKMREMVVQQAASESAEADAGEDTPEPAEGDSGPRWPVKTVLDLLSLVQDEFPANVGPEEVRGWDQATRQQVLDWATAVHLVASDNDVEIPPMPKVLDVIHPGQVSGFRIDNIANIGRMGGKTTESRRFMDVNVQHHIDTFGFAIEYEGDAPGVTMLLDPTKVTMHHAGLDYGEARRLLEHIADSSAFRSQYGTSNDPDDIGDVIARARKILGRT